MVMRSLSRLRSSQVFRTLPLSCHWGPQVNEQENWDEDGALVCAAELFIEEPHVYLS